MKTIILPGYSYRNKQWADELASQLKIGHDVIVHNWTHWEKSSSGRLSIKQELQKIKKEVKTDKFNIVGKSVGARITVRVVSEIGNNVQKIILCGVASVSDVTKEAYKKALSDFPESKIIVFQNTRDPFVPYRNVKDFMNSVNPKIRVIERPGNDHNYPYAEDFKKFLKS